MIILTNFLDSSVILCICFSLFQMCQPINWSAGSWSEKKIKQYCLFLTKREISTLGFFFIWFESPSFHPTEKQ